MVWIANNQDGNKMSAEVDSLGLVGPVVLLSAAVIAVPIFKRIGLGSILGYLIAGLIIGPFGFAFFNNPTAILHIAELGIVMYLFIIGLEMQPSHLWNLRKEIFGQFANPYFSHCLNGYGDGVWL